METFEMMEVIKPKYIQYQKHPIPGYKEIRYHIIFYINMDGKFTQKARLVANGHETEYIPKWDTYYSVISRDSVRIQFLYVALNNLGIFSCEISDAYLESPCVEKLWTAAWKEFVCLAGTPMRIIRALYGIKKYHFIYWNSVREAIPARWLMVLKEPGETNLVDIFTKQLPLQIQEDILNSIYSCDGKSVRYEE